MYHTVRETIREHRIPYPEAENLIESEEAEWDPMLLSFYKGVNDFALREIECECESRHEKCK